ncbi:TetR/AcrR family transcriptional regulator [Sanguibacter hominis ATCC BAA-789]|uniref:TetR/AcrR family transcriptional regulator n=1 Tax=Sanguibacter hominis ATCC BAA-789 TaxID=1312740 RepID=A0A9X5FAF2_9MICO|nr:TetR/AcrR family transcriptional regulator [Sanguibacter hominis ATCC BAA-789]
MRADALRRREALISAAREQFLRHGDTVALEAVAARAGVGIATLYRNFPSRQDLIDATACAVLADMLRVAQVARVGFTNNAEGAWRAFVADLVELRLGSVITALTHAHGVEPAPQVVEAQARTEREVDIVLDLAREASLLREDVGLTEFVLVVAHLSQPPTLRTPDVLPAFAPRLMAMLLAGMRPDGVPLPTAQ